ncbi:hypothetical protein DMENIID0001_120870 [Sergentomyia squamirostris]
MPLNTTSSSTWYTGVLNETDAERVDGGLIEERTHLMAADDTKLHLNWKMVIKHAILHLSAIYGAWLMLTSAKVYTIAFAYSVYLMAMIGITAGVHRLWSWSHRSYKAKVPLRIILMLFNSIAYQSTVIQWARDHRVHHKFSDTDADPHNATRGFFFSHIGWVLCRKHPDVVAKRSQVDISDLQADPVLQFQKKNYYIIMPIMCFILPTIIPMYFWNESFINSLFVSTLLRLSFSHHSTYLINSAAHAWGKKPYDRNLNPTENACVSFVALGEGWHNYHHAFPWDYKAAELGNYRLNFATAFIDFFAKIGWAYDLKTVSPEIIKRRAQQS